MGDIKINTSHFSSGDGSHNYRRDGDATVSSNFKFLCLSCQNEYGGLGNFDDLDRREYLVNYFNGRNERLPFNGFCPHCRNVKFFELVIDDNYLI